MSNWTDVSIAAEIIGMKLSSCKLEKDEMLNLLKEKELVALGDEKTIEKVINIYGKELKGENING